MGLYQSCSIFQNCDGIYRPYGRWGERYFCNAGIIQEKERVVSHVPRGCHHNRRGCRVQNPMWLLLRDICGTMRWLLSSICLVVVIFQYISIGEAIS